MGVNTRLLSEYAEMFRTHIREKMSQNLEKQSGIVKVLNLEI